MEIRTGHPVFHFPFWHKHEHDFVKLELIRKLWWASESRRWNQNVLHKIMFVHDAWMHRWWQGSVWMSLSGVVISPVAPELRWLVLGLGVFVSGLDDVS